MTILYTASATAKGGREGRVRSDDGTLDFPLTMPRSLGGNGAPGTNPEQLFAAGYSACFGSALALVARLQKIALGDHDITAQVSIGAENGGFVLAVMLRGRFADLSREQAETLMNAAHQVCPYSKATRGNIEVTLAVD
jgi:Ohr subfamily peroxiredoxin